MNGILSKFPILASLGLASVLSMQSNAAATKPTQKKVQTTQQVQKKDTFESMADYIGKWEGKRAKVYLDHMGNPTIGIGHLLDNSERDRLIISSLFKNKIQYDKLLDGTQLLSNSQIDSLFDVDVKIKTNLAKRKIPKYDTFPLYVKSAIINAFYRGDIGKKTIALINKGDWKNVSAQYLNHKNAKTRPLQIQRRMKSNALAFDKYSLELKKK